jgi:hypothetical protein
MEPTVFRRFGGSRTKFRTKLTYLWTNTIVKKHYYPLSVSFVINFSARENSTKNRKTIID